MTGRARPFRLALAGIVAAASVLAVSPPGAASRPARATRTTVRVVVRGCRDCSVQLVRYVPAEGGDPWSSRPRTVDARGHASFELASDRTRGLTFLVDAPWHGADGVAAVMAARYEGREVGERVSPAQAAAARHGEACWTGTTGSRARIVMRVTRFRSRTLTGGRTWHPRAWAVHGLDASLPMSAAPRGAIGTQYAIGCTPAAVRPVAHPRGQRRTTGLTFRVPTCEGCRITLGQWLDPMRPPWRSPTRVVAHGRVSFAVPSSRTRGMFVAVTAPWEGVTGYQTFAVLRYGDGQPGTRIGFAAARRQTQGSACWAGTTAAHRTITLAARRVRVLAPMSGDHVRGTIAWVPRQQRTWGPDRGVDAGVLGSEEAIGCERPARRPAG